MMDPRSLFRGCLITLAAVLGTLAVLMLALRLFASQVDALTPRFEALLEARVGVPVTIDRVVLSLERSELHLQLENLHAETADDQALIGLDRLSLRLDIWSTLRHLAPVFSDARMFGLEFHLYQQPDTTWGWPVPAKLPLGVAPQPEVSLESLDAWAGLLLRQRLWVDDSRVMLHGQQQTVMLHAPSLLLNGDQRRTRLEGALNIVERPDTLESELPAMTMRGEMQPGQQGFSDFSAALQLDMQLDHLVVLAALLRPDQMPFLEQVGGQVQLWGRWQQGALADARLDIDVPELTLRKDVEYAVLRNIHASGQWLRNGEGGEAWLSGNAETVEWAQPEGISDGPALPRHWYLSHQPGQWELRTSAFELSSLAAWREYALLPESLTRVLQTLSPRGQVQGLRLGQRDGRWGVDAALTNVAVLPWQQAPGGGPLDAWVQARDLRGRVTFNSAGDSTLYFPELFEVPMQLRHAEGVVEWVYDGPNTMISGRDLNVDWDGAKVSGGFGLIAGQQNGQFGLDIAFADVDALSRPLSQWLPMKAFDPALREWLENDIGGVVPQGSLKLSQPLGPAASAEQLSATLALEIAQGHLPIAPQWPRLEEVAGRLLWKGGVLQAEVERAQSQGVEVSQGAIRMEAEQPLQLSGRLQSDGASLLSFVQAIPDIGMLPLSDLSVDGSIDGDIALVLPLENLEALQLEINARPALSNVEDASLPIGLRRVGGALNWQQAGGEHALLGVLVGQWLGGDIRAELLADERIALQGDVDTSALWSLVELPVEQARQVISGRTQWQGEVSLAANPTLTLESRLLGITSALPEPFAKTGDQPWPWQLSAELESGRVSTQLADKAAARFQRLDDGNLAMEAVLGNAVQRPNWPSQPGWRLEAGVETLDPMAWHAALSPLMSEGASVSAGDGESTPLDISLRTDCLRFRDECFGAFSASGALSGQRAALELEGDMLSGRVDYQPTSERPLDIAIRTLVLDRLLDLPAKQHDATAAAPDSWVDAIETQHAPAVAIPGWLAELPNGRLRLADMSVGGTRFGPLTAYWQTDDRRFSLSPVGLTLGQLSLRGELIWEGNAVNSRTQADISIQGGDVGTALERLNQPVAMRSRTTDLTAQLTWPGAPWQMELSRAGGEMSADIRDGRFVTLESTPARLVGLLNFDNILRRLRFDFSDLTGQGTAFDRVHGTADVAQGQLLLRGPLQIDAPATTLTLTGSVNLLQRELDQRLGVTLPVSQSLPLAAIAVGAPIVGGALFIADQLFGDALDQATTIYYRVRGPWTSPQVTLEGPQ
ncbi:YhdP family protein [Vreelandella aquamarina]|uniref:YhdP family phospholipid transporter n=1 Tax=Vreelandella aquamarina TaxID=77097 RepID=UPI0038517FA0